MRILDPLVIVGASHAGIQLAAKVRQLGFDASIVLVGNEVHTPYQRPPLSKDFLMGKKSPDSLALRGSEFFTGNNIELRLGQRAVSMDPAARTLSLKDGSTIRYSWLALATGARCRDLPLPGCNLDGVFSLRTLDDALAISAAVENTSRACIIGGGFIGLEIASALVARGISVKIIESEPQLLTRRLPQQMSDYITRLHRQRGVEILFNCSVSALKGTAGQVQQVELDNGNRIECDIALLATGVKPNVELALDAGVACENGILTDAVGRTNAPNVIAIGDVANALLRIGPNGPARMRLESVQAATDGARAAASMVVGEPKPFQGVPWFWSTQHDIKLQMAGLPVDGDQIVSRGDMDADRFSLFFLRKGVMVASHSINQPADHMLSRKLILAGAKIPPENLQDKSFSLRGVLAGS